MSKTTGARRRSLVTRREVAREGHTSSLNRLYASLRNPTSTLSFPQYARLLSRLTSYTLLLRTLDSIQQSKHDRLLDTVLRTHEQRNQETSSQLRICRQILGWICTKSKASSERSATVALIPESAHAPRAHAPARTAPRATSRPFPALIRLLAAVAAI
jgi:hypothetical protein